MQQFILKGSILTACAMTIMASGTGGTTITNPPPLVDLGGGLVRDDGTVVEAVAVTGTLNTETGEIIVSDGSYTLRDPDGPDPVTGEITDGTAVAFLTDTGDYEYAYPIDVLTPGALSYGVVGQVTDPTKVPVRGTGTYTGSGLAIVFDGTTVHSSSAYTSTVNADFAAKTVDAHLTNGFAPGAAPFDTVSATGMMISGNSFSGGTVGVTNGGVPVNITGANTTSAAQGAFFGYDTGLGIPDEVGGAFVSEGDAGYIEGAFIAD